MLQLVESRALVGMELSELQEVLGSGQPTYRARQLYDALYRKQVANLSEISTLPQVIRFQLLTDRVLGLPALERRFESSDGTRRYLLRLEDDRTVEAVLMPEEGRAFPTFLAGFLISYLALAMTMGRLRCP